MCRKGDDLPAFPAAVPGFLPLALGPSFHPTVPHSGGTPRVNPLGAAEDPQPFGRIPLPLLPHHAVGTKEGDLGRQRAEWHRVVLHSPVLVGNINVFLACGRAGAPPLALSAETTHTESAG